MFRAGRTDTARRLEREKHYKKHNEERAALKSKVNAPEIDKFIDETVSVELNKINKKSIHDVNWKRDQFRNTVIKKCREKFGLKDKGNEILSNESNYCIDKAHDVINI